MLSPSPPSTNVRWRSSSGRPSPLQHGLLAEAVVESGPQLGLDPLEVERLAEDRGGSVQTGGRNEQIQVAEHPPGRIGIGEVGQRGTLQDPMLQTRGVEGAGGVEEQPFDPQGMGQPGLQQALEVLVLPGRDQHDLVPDRGAQEPEQAVVLALQEQTRELVVVERADGRGRRRRRGARAWRFEAGRTDAGGDAGSCIRSHPARR